jgi:hypothetical protein
LTDRIGGLEVATLSKRAVEVARCLEGAIAGEPDDGGSPPGTALP